MFLREVMYRAKVLNTKRWIYGQPFHIRGAWYMYKRGLWDKAAIVPNSIEQFTGVTDVKSKDICEGDIVTYQVELGVISKGLIVYENGSFGVDNWYLDEMKNIEIIGNIQDNPKLLEGTK